MAVCSADLVNIPAVISDRLVVGKQNILAGNPKTPKKRLFLNFNLAPDRSGVENLNNTTMGYSMGTSLSNNLYRKFSVESGIAYGSQVYNTDFSNYKPAIPYGSLSKPRNVGADCQVLDVQLNLACNLIKTKNFSLSFIPYYKLTLTEIGFANIRLRSAALIGITTNFKKTE